MGVATRLKDPDASAQHNDEYRDCHLSSAVPIPGAAMFNRLFRLPVISLVSLDLGAQLGF